MLEWAFIVVFLGIGGGIYQVQHFPKVEHCEIMAAEYVRLGYGGTARCVRSIMGVAK